MYGGIIAVAATVATAAALRTVYCRSAKCFDIGMTRLSPEPFLSLCRCVIFYTAVATVPPEVACGISRTFFFSQCRIRLGEALS